MCVCVCEREKMREGVWWDLYDTEEHLQEMLNSFSCEIILAFGLCADS